jgi:perosamine synthetase
MVAWVLVGFCNEEIVMLGTQEELSIFGGPPVVGEGAVQPWPQVVAADKEAVMGVLERGVLWGAAAPEAMALQEEWAAYVGARHCLVTNSGTAVLHMAVAAAGVQPGDEVITTPMSWSSTATSILHHNAIPVFADIDPETYTLDPKQIEAKITPRTRAILPVHLYGLPADMDGIMAVAEKHGLKVIEDCCQAQAARYNGRSVGTLGHIGAFSFNGNKNLPGGEGGALVTDDEEAWDMAARVQQFGERRRTDGEREYNVYGMGWMYRGTEMTNAFIRSQFTRLADTTARIQANAAYLSEHLAGIPGLRLPHVPSDRTHVYFRYVAEFVPEEVGLDVEPGPASEKVREALRAEGVGLGRAEFLLPRMTLFQEQEGYGRGCPWTCCYGEPIEYRPEDYPHASSAVDRVIPLMGLTPPNDETLMAAYVRAFEKVFSQLERVVA